MPSEIEIEAAARAIFNEVAEQENKNNWLVWKQFYIRQARAALQAAEAVRKKEHREYNDKLALEPSIENIF